MAQIKFTTVIEKFAQKGEKSNWEYILIPATLAMDLKPGVKVSFRVKGYLDSYEFHGVSLLPMGEGDFILPLNQKIRKGIKKGRGSEVGVFLEIDDSPFVLNSELIECIEEAGLAEAFYSQPLSHQKYFSKWIESAKTDQTKVRRIAQTIEAVAKKWDYGRMIREGRK